MIVDSIRINVIRKNKDGKNMRIAFSKSKREILKASAEAIGFEDTDNLNYSEEVIQLVVAAFQLGLEEHRNSIEVMDLLEHTMDEFGADELNVEME